MKIVKKIAPFLLLWLLLEMMFLAPAEKFLREQLSLEFEYRTQQDAQIRINFLRGFEQPQTTEIRKLEADGRWHTEKIRCWAADRMTLNPRAADLRKLVFFFEKGNELDVREISVRTLGIRLAGLAGEDLFNETAAGISLLKNDQDVHLSVQEDENIVIVRLTEKMMGADRIIHRIAAGLLTLAALVLACIYQIFCFIAASCKLKNSAFPGFALFIVLFVFCFGLVRTVTGEFCTVGFEYRTTMPSEVSVHLQREDQKDNRSEKCVLKGDGSWHEARVPASVYDLGTIALKLQPETVLEIRRVGMKTAGIEVLSFGPEVFRYTVIDGISTEPGEDAWKLEVGPAGNSWVFNADGAADMSKVLLLCAVIALAAAVLLTWLLLPYLMRMMRLHNPAAVGLAALFLLVTFAPFAMVHMPLPTEAKYLGNQKPADHPQLVLTQLTGYPEQYEKYFNSHVPFRMQLMQGYNSILYHLSGRASVDTVICGDDGWLFYDSVKGSDSDTIKDYTGTELYTQQQMERAAEKLRNYRQISEENGVTFAAMLAPNKSNIYGEYLPDEYRRAEVQRGDVLAQYLQESGLPLVYPKQQLLEEKDKQLYFKLDSHWNLQGVYVACRELFKELGGTLLPPLDQADIVSWPVKNGDLSVMALVPGLEDTMYDVNRSLDTAVTFRSSIDGMVQHYWNEEKQGKTLMILGDSFAGKMIPFLLNEYKKVCFVRYSPDIDLASLIQAYGPDDVVLEQVERNAQNLM